MERSYFEEEQRFRQPWLWTLLLGCSMIGVLVAVIEGWPISRPRDPIGAAIALVIGVGVPLLFYVLRLDTELSPTRLRVRFFPFVREEIPLSKIAPWEAHTYRPILEYGGWGSDEGLGVGGTT